MITDKLIAMSFEKAGRTDRAYTIGNAAAGASGLSSGEWTDAVGPDAGLPGYISFERIYIEAQGRILAPDFAMRALRDSGIYFGYAYAEGVDAYIWDFVPSGMPAVLRHIIVRDLHDRRLRVYAEVRPSGGEKMIYGGGLRIIMDGSCFLSGSRELTDRTPRSMRICFSDRSACVPDNDSALLSTPLGPDGRCTLIHSVGFEPAEHIGSVDAMALLDDMLG